MNTYEPVLPLTDPEAPRRVLVVDDEPGMRYMARRVLEPRFSVTEAANGEEALRVLERERFHFAVVDVRLPGISGLELLSEMKRRHERMDVVVMTGSVSNPDEALEDAVRRKAFFFLRKPFPMSILETLADRLVESQILEEQLTRHLRTLERDLESARVFQKRLLPPANWHGNRIEVSSLYVPSTRLSGDFIDYWPLPRGGTALFVADVMGHGPPSAMITGIVKSQIRSQAEGIDPGAVLSALEAELVGLPALPFFTALLVFDLPHLGEIRYCGAGHPPGFSISVSGAHRSLDSDGLPVNTGLPTRARSGHTLDRHEGDRLLLYTDGYPEARDQAGLPFDEAKTEGDSAFDRAVRSAARLDGPTAAMARLDAEWRTHTRGTVVDDDRAAVWAWLR